MNLIFINSVRTNNFKDELIMKKISELWQEASTQLSSREVVIYGVYYDYESDYKGDYSLSVAIESSKAVENNVQISEDSQYEVFNVNVEDDQGIINTWKEIWSREEEGTLNRAYSYDFEKYYPDGKIEIHIAIK
ncbi:GyrI-like domain-containing protein [Evansella cellulosilytica]|uniref:Transcription activator effector binding protein n=1 Tax=Evansella cellulosilytica (strain ATCC 21833 / DSM 2522 / FERM P-1141 / JCM 9156 / N-4) TaxID=649639 RepID=E6U1X9_EVAC2|nr:effector binding domain-containing protein [Evansella cellulosilytica]ADU29223.1 transcription activator effector binding protein [Evansella cellulosilytica DSM 2522]